MNTVTLDVRAPGAAMRDFAEGWRTGRSQKTARISFASPELLWQVLTADRIRVSPAGEAVPSPPSPLTPAFVSAVEAVAGELWPGVPVIPTMAAGATDGRFLDNAGLATYGVSGMFHDIDGSGVHAVDERIPVRSVHEGHEFLYRLVK